MEATNLHGSKPDVPHAGIDFFETDVIAGEGGGNIDPSMAPPYPAIGTDIAGLELPRFRGRYSAWVSSSLLIIIFIV